jgi:hypothetical protein
VKYIHQNVEFAVAFFQVPGDRAVILGPGDVEPEGLDVSDALRP